MDELHPRRGQAIEGKPRPVAPLGGPDVGEDLPDLSPVELLGLEHDLIRRIMTILERQSARIGEERHVDLLFLSTIVDFVHTYASRVHHGKEEEVLFRELDDLDLSAEHRRMMEELAREHVEMRSAVAELRQASEEYQEGEAGALDTIREAFDTLAELYPGHLETEDEDFFPAAMDYLDEAQRQSVLEQMRGHDRAMIHEKYGSVAEELEAVTEDWELRE